MVKTTDTSGSLILVYSKNMVKYYETTFNTKNSSLIFHSMTLGCLNVGDSDHSPRQRGRGSAAGLV